MHRYPRHSSSELRGIFDYYCICALVKRLHWGWRWKIAFPRDKGSFRTRKVQEDKKKVFALYCGPIDCHGPSKMIAALQGKEEEGKLQGTKYKYNQGPHWTKCLSGLDWLRNQRCWYTSRCIRTEINRKGQFIKPVKKVILKVIFETKYIVLGNSFWNCSNSYLGKNRIFREGERK